MATTHEVLAPATAASYRLVDYRVSRYVANEGNPVEYDVRCPDGTVLVFHNDGDGGSDFLYGRKAGGKVVNPTPEDLKREQQLAAWCRQQPAVVEFWGAYPQHSQRQPSTDGDTSIWAEVAAEDLLFDKAVARTAKRTVCWVTKDKPKDLRYVKIPKCKKVTQEWRQYAAKVVASRHPGATIWGA